MLCKQPGCPDEARYNRGAGAGYCEHHGRPRFQETFRLARENRQAHAPPEGERFEEKAKALVAHGKRLDRALARYRPVKGELEEAMKEWRSCLAQLGGEE